MLEELEIHDLGPIQEARITPAKGMTAITGETGAGKSMLLSAIRLISGAPAQSRRVRPGATQAWAQGVFMVDADNPAAIQAEEAGVDTNADDGELFLSRTIPVSGRSRSVLSGHSVPRSVLEDIAQHLVTIHGQADQLRIASAARQRDLLDAYAEDSTQLNAYHDAWQALKAVDERLDTLEHQQADARQRADYLRESIERINQADPQPGEDEELKAKRSRIENAASIQQGVTSALAALDASQFDTGSDGMGATDLVRHAAQSLRSIRMDGDDTCDRLAQRLDSIETDLVDVAFTLSRQLDHDDDEGDLDAINARIHELGELTRRWGPSLADVIAWRDKAVFEVEDLDASPEKLDQLRAQRSELASQALQAARELSAVRAEAAGELSRRVTAELAELAMAGASLDVRVQPRTNTEGDADAAVLDAHGMDDIMFAFTPFPGSDALPMGSSASGGELSRLMLALELTVAERRGSAADMTFIFDEVDAGVGGKAAAELGRRLAKLARTSQVIVVTHLAQVASWAQEQYVVSKQPAQSGASDEPGEASVVTTVTRVDGEQRIQEIARMLSGSESGTSLDHARELLATSVQ
ncbi:DNA repair protein RecN [Bifidobacterium boum]|uniref:DNA repair protein RecN n=1 Tax=Bifidobacterium boum TaxID=78343 RepID=UPI001F00B255|nr:DNA repair protein RecN [Bifidobacterium boum]MCF2561992.1 DNA repair protein RecN [Bifidobacterium boum]